MGTHAKRFRCRCAAVGGTPTPAQGVVVRAWAACILEGKPPSHMQCPPCVSHCFSRGGCPLTSSAPPSPPWCTSETLYIPFTERLPGSWLPWQAGPGTAWRAVNALIVVWKYNNNSARQKCLTKYLRPSCSSRIWRIVEGMVRVFWAPGGLQWRQHEALLPGFPCYPHCHTATT